MQIVNFVITKCSKQQINNEKIADVKTKQKRARLEGN